MPTSNALSTHARAAFVPTPTPYVSQEPRAISDTSSSLLPSLRERTGELLSERCRAPARIWLYRAMDRPERLLTPPFVFTIVAELGVFLTIGMLLPVLPVYAKDELGAGSIGIGIAVAAVSPTALLAQPLIGQLGDRRGRRLLVVSGPLIVAATVAAYTLASSLWELVGLRLVGGIGEALLYVGAATMVTDLAPANRRGEALC